MLVGWLHALAKKRSGIWRDIAGRHRPTEVRDQFAPVLRRAAEHRVPLVVLPELLRTVRRLEAGEIGMGEQLLDGLDAIARR